MKAWLECVECGMRTDLKEIFSCERCGSTLSVEYDLDRAKSDFLGSWRESGSVFDRFGALLPVQDAQRAVSLGEGNTPLVPAPRLAAELGASEIYLKLEGANPTHSFKDRQVAIAMSVAAEWGSRRFAIVSSGNAGISLAAYARRIGSEALIWVSGDSSVEKLKHARVFGPRVFVLPDPDGPSGATEYWAAIANLREFSVANGLVPMASARIVNPYMVEGAKTIAYETVAQLGDAPDWVFSPVGGGGIMGALWKGFREVASIGAAGSLPRMAGGQRTAYFVPIDALDDPAFGDDRYYRPLDGAWAFDAIKDSGGMAIQLDDTEIQAAQARLALTAGVFAEPRGAYSVAALTKALATGAIDGSGRIVCIISGSGLKDMGAATGILTQPPYEAPLPVASLREGLESIQPPSS
ncbi:MAG: pyridoxal-phosphate dependent enzyme [Actinomycetota bacterium]